MATAEQIDFIDAVNDADDRGVDKAILLGNGFTMDYNSTVVGYDSFAVEAKLANLSIKKAKLFEGLGSTNFEVVVEKLRARPPTLSASMVARRNLRRRSAKTLRLCRTDGGRPGRPPSRACLRAY